MGVKNREFFTFTKNYNFDKIDKGNDNYRVADKISFTIIKIVLSNQIWQPF